MDLFVFLSALLIFVVVSVPAVDDASSSVIMRLSVPEFDRAVILFEDSICGRDRDREGPRFLRGEREDDDEECPNFGSSGQPITPDLLNQMLAERVYPVTLS